MRGLSKARLSCGEAAEYQARGAVHFHILLRLYGIAPDQPDVITPPDARCRRFTPASGKTSRSMSRSMSSEPEPSGS
ncbi:replication initiator [Nonomuraea wenchangensis]